MLESHKPMRPESWPLAIEQLRKLTQVRCMKTLLLSLVQNRFPIRLAQEHHLFGNFDLLL
jgi:hypothetical protein